MCVLEMFLIDIYGLFFIWASSIKFQATKIWRVPAWRATRDFDILRALQH